MTLKFSDSRQMIEFSKRVMDNEIRFHKNGKKPKVKELKSRQHGQVLAEVPLKAKAGEGTFTGTLQTASIGEEG